mgnify:CR=1 FL=1
MEIKKISVVGGGTMGNGIAHVFAMKGYDVNLIETNEELWQRGFDTISKNLDRQVKKEIISSEDKDSILGRIHKIIGVEGNPSDTDLVIEAIYENKEAKLNVFKTLAGSAKADCIFASNTSSISITELSSAVPGREDKFIGMHFMNPVPVMKLIEIIRGYSTSDITYNIIKDLSITLDKTPV